MSGQVALNSPGDAASPAAPAAAAASPAAPTVGQDGRSFTYSPTTDSGWVRPGYAVVVVSVVALAVLGVVVIAVLHLDTGSGTTPAADPNAATITAIASTAIAAIVSLTAAYFGIKVASENAAQATSTAAMALEVASKVSANSTTNGNPGLNDL